MLAKWYDFARQPMPCGREVGMSNNPSIALGVTGDAGACRECGAQGVLGHEKGSHVEVCGKTGGENTLGIGLTLPFMRSLKSGREASKGS